MGLLISCWLNYMVRYIQGEISLWGSKRRAAATFTFFFVFLLFACRDTLRRWDCVYVGQHFSLVCEAFQMFHSPGWPNPNPGKKQRCCLLTDSRCFKLQGRDRSCCRTPFRFPSSASPKRTEQIRVAPLRQIFIWCRSFVVFFSLPTHVLSPAPQCGEVRIKKKN